MLAPTLAEDKLVELVEDGDLDLVTAALSHLLGNIGEILGTVINILLQFSQLDNVTLDPKVSYPAMPRGWRLWKLFKSLLLREKEGMGDRFRRQRHDG